MSPLTLMNTASAATGNFSVDDKFKNAPIMRVSGLGAAETVDLQMSQDGSSYADIYVSGTQVQVTSTNNSIPIDQVGLYRANKGGTTGAVLVTLHYGEGI